MVWSNACSQTKTQGKEKSPSPTAFKEPEGMVSVDLNSPDYNRLSEEPSENKKCKHKNQLKYWIRVLCMIGVMFLGVSTFIFVMLVDKEYKFFNKTPIEIAHRKDNINTLDQKQLLNSQFQNPETTEKFRFLTTTKNFRETLTSGTYLENFDEKLELCKLKKTLEDCCGIFAAEDGLTELKEFCTVNEMLNILLEYEKNFRLKRNVATGSNYDYYHQPPNEEESLLPAMKDIFDNVKSEVPAFHDRMNNFLEFPNYEDYHNYVNENEFKAQQYGNNYEVENDYNGLHQSDNDFDYRNRENNEDYMQGPNSQKEFETDKLLPKNGNSEHHFERQPFTIPNFNFQGENFITNDNLDNSNQPLNGKPEFLPLNEENQKSGTMENFTGLNNFRYPFNSNSSLEVTGIKGGNKTLEINLANTTVDLFRSKDPKEISTTKIPANHYDGYSEPTSYASGQSQNGKHVFSNPDTVEVNIALSQNSSSATTNKESTTATTKSESVKNLTTETLHDETKFVKNKRILFPHIQSRTKSTNETLIPEEQIASDRNSSSLIQNKTTHKPNKLLTSEVTRSENLKIPVNIAAPNQQSSNLSFPHMKPNKETKSDGRSSISDATVRTTAFTLNQQTKSSKTLFKHNPNLASPNTTPNINNERMPSESNSSLNRNISKTHPTGNHTIDQWIKDSFDELKGEELDAGNHFPFPFPVISISANKLAPNTQPSEVNPTSELPKTTMISTEEEKSNKDNTSLNPDVKPNEELDEIKSTLNATVMTTAFTPTQKTESSKSLESKSNLVVSTTPNQNKEVKSSKSNSSLDSNSSMTPAATNHKIEQWIRFTEDNSTTEKSELGNHFPFAGANISTTTPVSNTQASLRSSEVNPTSELRNTTTISTDEEKSNKNKTSLNVADSITLTRSAAGKTTNAPTIPSDEGVTNKPTSNSNFSHKSYQINHSIITTTTLPPMEVLSEKPKNKTLKQNNNPVNLTKLLYNILPNVHDLNLKPVTEPQITEDISQNQLRSNQADGDFRSKSKSDTFSTISEDVQTNQQSVVNPCYFPYMPPYASPYRVGSPYDGNQMMQILPASQPQKVQQSMYVLNPPMYYSYPPPSPYLPNYYPPAAPQQHSYSSAIRASGPGGQYYLCNPIPAPTNNIAGLPGVEIRREAYTLQDLVQMKDMDVEEPKNLTKTISLICSIGEQACADNSKCISNHLLCDNEVQCDDGSDEIFCSCKERVGRLRACDGYCDCPDCNDELGCFGCKEDEFSCDDWSRFRRSTCIPIEQRCDNIRQCEVTGKDEEDCSSLNDHIGSLPFNKVSNSVGFLHRNYKGKWYPTCFGTDTWATEVCKAEAGPSLIVPRTHMVLTKDLYDGDYINVLPNNEISLVNTCVQDRAAFVECPPIFCGLRMIVKNPYRPQEVDTSIENMINEMERAHILKEVLNETNIFNDPNEFVGAERVVGGKPSQPGAWPWLVAIYKNGIFHCGGVIINEMWVITAAHCMDRYWLFYYEVQAGTLRRFSYPPMDQSRWITAAIAHEKYNKIDLNHDIALVKLSSPLRYNKYVRPICLPSETTAGRDFLDGPTPGTICTAVGWGATVEHGADPDHMREVEVPVLKHCKHKEDLESVEICAGLSEGGKDACQGDSGGPFMCRNPNNPNQWYLAGVVSHGEGCARPHEPGVYTRVSKYIAWIAENTKDDRFLPRIPLQKCPGYVCNVVNRCLPKKRRCDKIVDCLLGDDEENCEIHYNDIFKHKKRQKSLRGPEVMPKPHENFNIFDDIIEDFIPQFRDENSIPLNIVDGLAFRSSNTSDTITKATNSLANTTSFPDGYFKCKILLQIVPQNKRCNRMIDCEDGTDEVDCKCVDYIKNIDPATVCDGITDCADDLDETNCVQCSSSEYQCRQSQTCIPLSQRCDSKIDCFKKEDEQDCFALTDGSTLNLDSDLRPSLTASGVITINRFGVWKPFCNANMSNNEPSIATNVCNLLGFEEYIAYHKYRALDKELEVTMDGFTVKNGTKEGMHNSTCSGLYVRCSNITLHSTIHDIDNYANTAGKNNSTDQELYKLPWLAAIYSDGEYRCMGAILDATRIVTSIKCFQGITMISLHYVVALLGKGKFGLQVQGPYDQIIRIIEAEIIESTDIIVLKTQKNITFNRYVRATNLEARRDGHRMEKCVTAGIENGRSKFIRLRPFKPCSVDYRCFESKRRGDCKKGIFPWSGVIVCDSGNGWYPAAVFYEENGSCDFSLSIKKYTSIKFYKNQITKALEENTLIEVSEPICDGFLCDLGQCLQKDKTCDGIPDCMNAEDEKPELCYEKARDCHLTNNCVCPRESLKCQNQKCLPKSSFCDRNHDCSNREDEPTICACKNYLELTNPEKICDGVLNCLDRSDEDPGICPCRVGSFVCEKSAKCIPQELVCDGYNDCPDGEDEGFCLALKAENSEITNAGEVMVRSFGIWHSGCFNLNYTTSKLEAICAKLGFQSGSATQLYPPRDVTSITAMRPETDMFDVVWIRRTPGNKFRLRIRTGNDPYVSFKRDTSCYRLFIACI